MEPFRLRFEIVRGAQEPSQRRDMKYIHIHIYIYTISTIIFYRLVPLVASQFSDLDLDRRKSRSSVICFIKAYISL